MEILENLKKVIGSMTDKEFELFQKKLHRQTKKLFRMGEILK